MKKKGREGNHAEAWREGSGSPGEGVRRKD